MASRQLKIELVADPSGLNSGFSKAEGRFKTFSKAAGVAGVALGGVLTVGLTKSVGAAVEAEKSQAKLQAQLKASGISYTAHAKQIDAVIQRTSKLAALDDEDLQAAFTNIVRSTKSVSEGLKLTAIAADVARAKHMDVAAAGVLVGKVYNGNVGALKRLGIAFTPVTKAQDALKASTTKVTDEQKKAAKQADMVATKQSAIAALQRTFSGQAEAYGKTTAGSMERFQVAIENLQESLGAALLPVVQKVAAALSGFATWAERNQRTARALAIAAGVLSGALIGLFVVEKVATAIKTLRAAMVALNASFLTNPVVLVGAAIVALGAALVVAYKKSETFRNVVNGAFNAVKSVVTGVISLILRQIELYIRGLGLIASAASHLPLVGSKFRGIADAVNGAANSVRGLRDQINGLPNIKTVHIQTVIDGRTVSGTVTSKDTLTPTPRSKAKAKKSGTMKRFGYRTTPGATQIGEDWQFMPWDPGIFGGQADTTTTDTTDTSIADLAQQIAVLAAAVQAQTAFGKAVAATTGGSLAKTLADVLGAQIIGYGYAPRAQTAGSGVGARY